MSEPADVERLVAVTTPFVAPGQGGVDLFGRDVRHVPDAGSRLRRAALLCEARARQQADREVGAGPLEVDESSSSASSRLAFCQIWSIRSPRPQRDPARRGGTRARRPARAARARRLPEIRIDDLRPARRRIRRHRPGDRTLVDHLERLRDRRQPVERRRAQDRRRRAGPADERHEHGRAASRSPSRSSIRFADHAGTQPSVPSRARLVPDPLHLRVEVLHVDVPRPLLVGPAGDRATRGCASGQRLDRSTWSGWTLAPTETIRSA